MKRSYPPYDDQAGEKIPTFGDQQGQGIGKPSRFAKSLCVSNISAQVPDDALVNELQSTFQQFGDMSVKIAGYMGRRVAYLNFYDEKSANDAYERFLTKSLPLFDRGLHIEPVRSTRPRAPRENNHEKMGERYNQPGERYNQPKPPGTTSRRDQSEGKPHRYAHHLDRTLPEDDQNATRTLFVGNLDPAITKEDIIKAFSPFGILLDVDIKWSGQNSSMRASQNPVCFAFLRFKTVDEAYAAKLGMSGQMLLSHTVKIGYGKIVPSACLWVGNIANSTAHGDIERDFSKFGQILRFKVETNPVNNERFAVILFESNDTAGFAASKMRAYRYPRTNRRLRVDFIGPDEFDQYITTAENAGEAGDEANKMEDVIKAETEEFAEQKMPVDSSESSALAAVKQASSLTDLCTALPRIWSGQFLVKSSIFLGDFHVFAGDGELVASHMAGNSSQLIKLGQRVSITDSHIEELKRRCLAARGSYCVLLVTNSNDSALLSRARRNPNSQLTIRPLRALSLYLQSKSTMAVFMLQSQPFTTSVVLCYVLPSCQFVDHVLTKYCPNLQFERENCGKDDYLMVICFRSASLHV